jgi:tRNA pseudouridine38-40 synthase
MPRYFIEVSYKGTNYAGFQVQKNANSIQAEVSHALQIFFHNHFELTGASRTDAGVHAKQNFFHFDFNPGAAIEKSGLTIPAKTHREFDVQHPDVVYHLNSILPPDIVIKKIFSVTEYAHCRFDAIEREYRYYVYRHKDPFLNDRAYFYPYKLNLALLQDAAKVLLSYNDFGAFAKKNSQAKHYICHLKKSEWVSENDLFIYHVTADRFLRGMVKGLVGTMIQVGTGKISLDRFIEIVKTKDPAMSNFSVPGHALFLYGVSYSDNITQHL